MLVTLETRVLDKIHQKAERCVCLTLIEENCTDLHAAQQTNNSRAQDDSADAETRMISSKHDEMRPSRCALRKGHKTANAKCRDWEWTWALWTGLYGHTWTGLCKQEGVRFIVLGQIGACLWKGMKWGPKMSPG